MTENQNPENAPVEADDVEAHGLRAKVAAPQEPTGEDGDDVEGHGVRVRI